MTSSTGARALRASIQHTLQSSAVRRWVDKRLLSSQSSRNKEPVLWALSSASSLIRNKYPTTPTSCSFTTTSQLRKKGGKSNTSHARSDSLPPVDPAAQTSTKTGEAFDVSELESGILKAIERLTHGLSLLRAGGKLNPDVILNLNVTIGKGDDRHKVKLSDLAQVVPRGRIMNVIVGEEEHIKAVTSAITSSEHSLNPNPPLPDNPLTIPVPIPPPTGESRQKTVEEAKSLGRLAVEKIQSARAAHHKKVQKLKAHIREDDLYKATKIMEDITKNGKGDAKRIVDGAVKVLDQH